MGSSCTREEACWQRGTPTFCCFGQNPRVCFTLNGMKELAVPRVQLGHVPLEHAFKRVFGRDTLQRVHGPSLRMTDWDRAAGTRKIQFAVEMGRIPKEVARFFCGERLRVTTNQTCTRPDANTIVVSNRMRLHFLGAEMFSVRPTFRLSRDDAGTFLTGIIEHHARLPPPLNSVVESFMVRSSRRELEKFAEVLRLPSTMMNDDAP